jgi:hypothetical protein
MESAIAEMQKEIDTLKQQVYALQKWVETQVL